MYGLKKFDKFNYLLAQHVYILNVKSAILYFKNVCNEIFRIPDVNRNLKNTPIYYSESQILKPCGTMIPLQG